MTVMTTGSGVPSAAAIGMPAVGAPPSSDGSAAFAEALSSVSGIPGDQQISNPAVPVVCDPSTVETVVSPTVSDPTALLVTGIESGKGVLPPGPSDGSVTKREAKEQTLDLEPSEPVGLIQGLPIQPTLMPVPLVVPDSTSPVVSTAVSGNPSPTSEPSAAIDSQPMSSARTPTSPLSGQLPAPNVPEAQPLSSESPTGVAAALPAEKLFEAVVSVALSAGDAVSTVVGSSAVQMGVNAQGEDNPIVVNPGMAKSDVKPGSGKFGGLGSDSQKSSELNALAEPASSVEPIAVKPVAARSSTDTTADQKTIESTAAPTSSGVHVRGAHVANTDVSGVVSTTNPSVSSAHADAVEVAHQLGRHIAGARLSSLTHDRPMHLSVLLHPEDLGEVSVQLTLMSGRIDVQVSSQSDTTRDMLRQGMQDLRRQLSDSGVSVGDMDVRDGWSQQSNSSQNSANSADQRGSQRPRLADVTATSSSRMTTPEPTVVHRPSRTGIDILA